MIIKSIKSQKLHRGIDMHRSQIEKVVSIWTLIQFLPCECFAFLGAQGTGGFSRCGLPKVPVHVPKVSRITMEMGDLWNNFGNWISICLYGISIWDFMGYDLRI